MGVKRQGANLILALVLTTEGVTTTPAGVPKLPEMHVVYSGKVTPEMEALAGNRTKARTRAVVRQAQSHVFKGGFKKVTGFKVGLLGADSIGFWFIDLVSALEISAEFCKIIFSDYAGFVIKAPWEDHVIAQAAAEIFRQGETTQDAQERVTQEAAQCCKAVSQASAEQLTKLAEIVKEFTYKAPDTAPRKSVTKRTRL